MSKDGALAALVEIVARMDSAWAGGMRAQLQWLEDAALAIERCELGDDGARASTDLKAALGAVVHWARGPQNPTTVVELEALVRGFTSRGLLALYRALAVELRAGAASKPPRRAALLDLAGVFDALAAAQASGAAPPEDALRRLAALRDAFE